MTTEPKDKLPPARGLAPADGSAKPHTPAQYVAFGREVLARTCERVSDGIMGEDDEVILEIAFKHGLVHRVKYDPRRHGASLLFYCESGDEIWWWGETEILPNDEADRSQPR